MLGAEAPIREDAATMGAKAPNSGDAATLSCDLTLFEELHGLAREYPIGCAPPRYS